MSLNRKRRIFRSGSGSMARFTKKAGVLLAAACGVATLLVAALLFFGASDAPARVPATGQIAVRADQVTVPDAGTLLLGGQAVRLEGIVAPARGSLCRGVGQAERDCGAAAASALAALVAGRSVACALHGADHQGRPIGDCTARTKPLSAGLVEGGWARAEAKDLQQAEATARAGGRGLWSPGCEAAPVHNADRSSFAC